MTNTAIGLIGGSGLYAMEGLTETREHLIETPSALRPIPWSPAVLTVSPSSF